MKVRAGPSAAGSHRSDRVGGDTAVFHDMLIMVVYMDASTQLSVPTSFDRRGNTVSAQ